MKIVIFYEGPPPQGLSEAQRGKKLFSIVTNPPRGRPIGGDVVHRNWEY